MPRRRDAQLTDANAQEIASAYYRAKIVNPKLTQREFARKGMPTISARYQEAESAAERKRIEQSGARYLRLVLEGKRTGRVNVEKAKRFRPGQGSDQFQVFLRDKMGVPRSFDLTAVGARSQLDVPTVEAQLRNNPAAIAKRIAQWRERYAELDIDEDDIADMEFEVRRVQIFRKHAERINLDTGAHDPFDYAPRR